MEIVGVLLIYLIAFVVGVVIGLAACAPLFVAFWFIFKKAGRPGWKALIPFYNKWVTYEVIDGKGYKMFFSFIPVFHIYWDIVTNIALAHSYGKSTGFGVGMYFLGPIFQLILAFDKSEYQGPAGLPF